MIKKYYRLLLCTIMTVFTVGMLSGCANSGDTTPENTTSVEATPSIVSEETTDTENTTNSENTVDTVEDVSYPITITHAFGETVIESKPERVSTVAWGNQDVPLALGVVPVGVSKANFGVSDDSGLLPWTKAAYEALGVTDAALFDDIDGLDYEAISDSQPDVILCSYSGITQEEYDLLSAIAPVVAYPENAWETFWREQTIMNTTGMGMEAEGKQLVADTEALIAEKTAEYDIEGVNTAFFYFDPANLGTFYIYTEMDPRAAYLKDLGLAFPESVKELVTEETGIALTLSSEMADSIKDIDVIITYGDASLLEALQADPVLGVIPAIKNGSVVLLDASSSLSASCTPSVLSIRSTIDEYLALIKDAASKAE